MSIDEAIEQFKYDAECNRADLDISYAEENEQIAEWLEKLKYIENIILKWNADIYNDEDTGIPDDEILEAIFNACNDNGFDIPVDEDFRKGYNKAIDDYRTEICKAFVQEERNGNYRFYAVEIKQLIADLAEQLKEGGADACGI